MADYKYRVTGPRGGKYLTTTRKEAEKLTKHGGSFRALGQRKASKVKNPARFIKVGKGVYHGEDGTILDEWSLHHIPNHPDPNERGWAVYQGRNHLTTVDTLRQAKAWATAYERGGSRAAYASYAKLQKGGRKSRRNPGPEILWGGGGQGYIKGEIPRSRDLFTIEKAHISAPWVLRLFEDGRAPGRVLDHGYNANKLKKAAQRYVDTVTDHVPTLNKYRNPHGNIVEGDVDHPHAVYGSYPDLVYVNIGEGEHGWYVTTTIDSETGSFMETYYQDDGPYETWNDAARAGENAAFEWCINNGVPCEGLED
tara:strand:- start:15 stop:944 length:930 start_codon:yes stop_codon:yes gene_type:complete